MKDTVTELVVSCEGLSVNTSSQLHCRFKNGTVVPATYDAESRSISCACPKALKDGGVGFDVVNYVGSEEEEPMLRDSSSSHLQYRPASGNDTFQSLEQDRSKDVDDMNEELSVAKVMKGLSFIDRYLAVWIIAAMVLGVLLGVFVPNIQDSLDVVQIDKVSLPVALGLWIMMYPVLCKVRYEVLGGLFKNRAFWGQLGFSLVLNWVVGPALMTALSWATLPDLDAYRNGVIIVGIARCIAMVLIWNQLAHGHPEYCAILVAVNSVLQILLFAPLSVFYLQVVSRQYMGTGEYDINFWDVARSVLIYLGAPLGAAIITRYTLFYAIGEKKYYEKFIPVIGPFALVALLYTIIILFALQGKNVVDDLGNVARVAIPLLLYFSIMWTVTMWLSRVQNFQYSHAVTQSFTASSNNFELAIAVAVGAFGIDSKEALAATVGPLIEVPVLLALVYVALYIRKRIKWQ